jgi:hypothetical protein
MLALPRLIALWPRHLTGIWLSLASHVMQQPCDESVDTRCPEAEDMRQWGLPLAKPV